MADQPAPGTIRRDDITGIVLAGGLGRRMTADGSGLDKGLQPLDGRPMVVRVIERLRPQVAAIVVSANQNLETYRGFGHPVITDRIDGFAGPLAGVHAGLLATPTRYAITVPCDAPFLPTDLVTRLVSALAGVDARIAVARTEGRRHPVIALLERSLVESLGEWLAQGGRKVDAWQSTLPRVEVDFDDPDAFRNINTADELARLR